MTSFYLLDSGCRGFLIFDIPMCYSDSKNKIIVTSNTSMFIVDRSRQHVSTLTGSSSGLLFV